MLLGRIVKPSSIIEQEVFDFIKANQDSTKVTRVVITKNFPDADEDRIHNAIYKLRHSNRIAKFSKDFAAPYYRVLP